MSRPLATSRGPFRADQIRPGDPYELSNGHAIHCMGTGGRGSRANLVGGSVLDSDPAVEEAGVDTGYSPSADTLRAPDVAVGNVPDAPGWVAGAPPLAVEYADTGKDEKELVTKISELFDAGTKLVWVVRLVGPRRVEVHEPGKGMRLLRPGEELVAPGTLQTRFPSKPSTTARRPTRSPCATFSNARATRTLTRFAPKGEKKGEKKGENKDEKKLCAPPSWIS